ncbi:MAG: hypothetical protein ACO3PR_12315 [Limisphaerales bacterium]
MTLMRPPPLVELYRRQRGTIGDDPRLHAMTITQGNLLDLASILHGAEMAQFHSAEGFG